MRLLRSAAVLAAALSTLLGAPASTASVSPRGVDITAPAVGSCHALTYAEAQGQADPDPAVACTDAHTSMTTKVITFASTPDWSSDAVFHQVSAKCERAKIDYFGDTKTLELSMYFTYFFYPTKAQRDAGANWARCDLALNGKAGLQPLPTDGDPALGSLPLPDKVAKCRQGKAAKYAVVSCDHGHRYRATTALKHPGSAYPGLRKVVSWTVDRCRASLGRSFGYYAAPTHLQWRIGYRYSICYKTTRN